MEHIDTKSEEEKKARNDYQVAVKGDVVIADDKVEATVHELLDLRHKMDEDALKASKLKAIIMNAMKSAEQLKNKKGLLLATWTSGRISKTVDYKKIFVKYGVSDEDIKANTKESRSSRNFSIEEI